MMGLAVCVVHPASAAATYPGHNSAIAWQYSSSAFTCCGRSVIVTTAHRTLLRCQSSSGPIPCAFGAPSWSPDGRELVTDRAAPGGRFALAPPGGPSSLVLVRADGSHERILARQTKDDERPAFLPSGRAIVFEGTGARGAHNLYSVGTNGRGLRQLTHGGARWPAPCPNGTIAFRRRNRIYLLDPRSGQPRLLTHGGVGSMDCSPDSSTVVFATSYAIFTISTTGGQRVRLVQYFDTRDPRFSPDGKRLAFVREALTSPVSYEYLLGIMRLETHAVRIVRVLAADIRDRTETSVAGLDWQPRP
jgi:Tol biopolymer transport system component